MNHDVGTRRRGCRMCPITFILAKVGQLTLARKKLDSMVRKVKLPNPDSAIIPRNKIEDYLLSSLHPVGRHKAVVFASLGFTQAEWPVLESELRKLASGDAQLTEDTEYGTKYEIRGMISGPKGASARIITAWIVRRGEDFPRFITAYPED